MHDIAILAYPGCVGITVFGLADLLLIANHLAENMGLRHLAPFTTRIVAVRSGGVALAGGMRLQARALRQRPHLLVVPGLEVGRFGQWPNQAPGLHAEIAFVRRRNAAGVPLASVCMGSFLLAEAGVLDGRRAATSWPFEREFAERFPAVHLQRQALLCVEDGLITAGAVTSAFDLGLHLVRAHFGERVARAAARLSLVDAQRASQKPYVDNALVPAPAAPFSAQVNRWLATHLAQPYDLSRLAQAFHASTRTLLRRYRQDTGTTPLRWLQQARVDHARRLLESGTMRLGQVVSAVGYEDAATFSRLFRRQVGQSPGDYRRRARSEAA
jgi:transcriptional regulator GlxA family with amidase domain